MNLEEMPIGRLLGIAGRLVTERFHRLVEAEGITPAGWHVLSGLAERDGQTLSEIAEACFVSPATMTGVVDTLERDGLVARVREGADRRVVRLTLTEDGRRRQRTAKARFEAAMREVWPEIAATEERAVRRFLSRTIRTLEGLTP